MSFQIDSTTHSQNVTQSSTVGEYIPAQEAHTHLHLIQDWNDGGNDAQEDIEGDEEHVQPATFRPGVEHVEQDNGGDKQGVADTSHQAQGWKQPESGREMGARVSTGQWPHLTNEVTSPLLRSKRPHLPTSLWSSLLLCCAPRTRSKSGQNQPGRSVGSRWKRMHQWLLK